MKNILIIIVFTFLFATAQSQNFKFDSHKDYIKQVTDSHITTYKDVISKFDAQIKKYPEDIVSIIEKCKFITAYTYASSEMLLFDSIEQDFDACESLTEVFSDKNPELILYKLSKKWSDEAVTFYDQIDLDNLIDWSQENIKRLYLMMETKTKSIEPVDYKYAHLGYEKTQNPAFILGSAHYQLNNNNKSAAIKLISDYQPDDQDKKIDLIKLLLKLENPQSASELLDSIVAEDVLDNTLKIKIKTATNPDYQLPDKELDVIKEKWDFDVIIQELYDFSLQHENFVVAHKIHNYRSTKDFWHDPFKYNKFKLYQQSKIWQWDIQDLYGFLMWLAMIFVSIFVTFLILSPIHYRGLYRRVHNKPQLKSLTQWNLKHALFVGSIFILSDFVLSIIFQYQSFYSSLFMDQEVDLDISNGLLSTMYFYLTFILLGSGLIVINAGKELFIIEPSKIFRSFLLALGAVVILKVAFVSSVFFYKLLTLAAEIDSVKLVIEDMYKNYGAMSVFLTIAFLTPIAEELMFRGILLNSFSKHISFRWANAIQASLFALIHDDLQLFLYFFVFGMIAGEFVKRQKHMYGAIAFHIINNAMAVSVLVLR